MTKLATRPKRRIAAITTLPGARQRTETGGHGYTFDAKTELFNLAASNMVSEQTFHEDATKRDTRFVDLIHEVVAEDPEWVARFVPYLRHEMFMRSAAIVMAAEYVAAGGPNGRSVVSSAIARADEPAEMLGYWQSVYGRKLPAPVKRGVADAVRKQYNERNALKYDGVNNAWRFADVIEVVHPTPTAPWQSDLWKFLLDQRHHSDGWERLNPETDSLGMLAADAMLRELPEKERRAALDSDVFDIAGWSWERLSGWLPGGMDAQAWEAVIPNMGYMALLRNLRNFDEANVSDEGALAVCAKLTDPLEVLKAKQFPWRIYSAYKEIGSLRWAPALEKALTLTLDNVPRFAGSTLVLVDLSPSMGRGYGGMISKNSKRERYELAALFGSALAKRAEDATIVFYSGPSSDVSGEILRQPLLRTVETAAQWMSDDQRGGTETFAALNRHYDGHDRVVILTDEQTSDAGIRVSVPAHVPIYSFNLAGYKAAHAPHGTANWHSFAGLNDSAFRLLPVLEQRGEGEWPF